MPLLNILAGLSQGFADGQNARLKDEGNEELKKLQVKMFKRELEMKDEAEAAKKQLISALAPIFSSPEPPVEGSQQTAANLYPQQSGGLREYLKTGAGQATALKAGYKLDDIKKYQQLSLPEIMAQLQTQGAIGGGTSQAGGLHFSGLDVDAEGNSKVKFDTSQVKNWALSPDGRSEIGYDQNGKPIAQRPAGADKRVEEDKPLGTTGAKDMVNDQGQNPPPTMSAREAVAKGFKMKEEKVQLSDAARLALSNEGAKNIQTVIDKLAPNGKVSKSLVVKMSAPGGGIGEGRELNQLADTALSGQILLQSGVSVRPEELESLRRTYIPSIQDFTSEGLAERKLQRFKALLEGNLDMASLPPNIRAKVEERRAMEKKGGNKEDPLGIRKKN